MLKRIAIVLAMFAIFMAGTVAARAEQAARAAAGANAIPSASRPKAQVEEPLYDFGAVLEGTTVKHTFRIKNAGQGRLLIRSVKTSCGCTAAKPSKTELAPGEETAITVGFDTRFQKGHQVRLITAYTNDPGAPRVTMTMQGSVKQQAAATPAQVAFGTVRQGAEATREVLISGLPGPDGFRVGPVANSNPAIKVVKAPRPDGKPGALLRISLLKTMPVGQFDDTVKVATNRVPLLIDVFGAVAGDLSVEPPQVSFGIVARGHGAVRIIRLINQGARPVRVIGVTSDNVAVSGSAAPVSAGKEYKVTVELHQGTPDGQVRGRIHIKTDDPKQETLNVPFYGIVGRFQL